ncbi:His Kinase A (phospho-acceptor) domain-containing protein [Aquimarina amphilecti]|uniref:histidine kinase n=1 Tax=Aquimarina amphilecti TaxID=1038014 RepID=A0A1H7Q543_AQUAM|nr:transporter substrate-binding domain-containing protein [Aquimarina amphilecti]SEL42615.1 His Kinase A (phospho-acceptor) domain-containing protein [Aquimarina amphilecti]
MKKKIAYVFIFFYLIVGVTSCSNQDILSESQRDWLLKQDAITVAVYAYYPPYQFINKKDSIDGILVDHFGLIEKKIDYRFRKKYYTNWSNLIKDAQNNKIDIVLEMQETAGREKYLNFYTKFFETPFVLVVREETDSTLKFNNFLDKRITVPKGYSIDDHLKENYSNLNIKNYPDDITCLLKLQSGEADAYIGGKALVNYLIKSEGITGLKVITEIDYSYIPSIAVSKENKTLNEIIAKATRNITDKEKQEILDNWLFDVVKPFYKKPKFWFISSIIFFTALASIILIHFYLKFKIKQKTQELQIAKDKAEESNRIKTNFIQNISHEIRTPMNGIMGFSELLKSDVITEEERQEYTEIIIASGKDLITSVDNILEISVLETKQSKVRFTPTNLEELFSQLISEHSPKANEKNLIIKLENKIPKEENIIITDHPKLYKILSSLIDNGIKFTHSGSIIIFSYIVEDYVAISIKDTGIGIKQKDRDIIFKSFSQSEKEISKNFGGLGLGLAIAKEYTNLIGGNISFISKEQEGSAFLLKIPYTPMQNNAELSTKKKGEIIPEKHVVLIAEDGEVNFLFLKTVLTKMIDFEFIIYRAKNGKEAVEICQENEKIDLVLMDIKMPIMDGYDATKRIKKMRPDLPVVAQTAYSTEEDIEKALEAGCDDFLAKPVDRKILKPILDKYISIFKNK